MLLLKYAGFVTLLSIVLSILGCSSAYAEDATPSPVPTPEWHVRNIQYEGGLLRPEMRDKPNPYLKISWELGEDFTGDLALEIRDRRGRTRPQPANWTKGDLLWVWSSNPSPRGDIRDLREAGCELTETYALLTADCFERFRPYPRENFPKGFLQSGMRYEIRVYHTRSGYYPLAFVTIPELPPAPTPTPTTPTPTRTPIPTPTHWPTATPIPPCIQPTHTPTPRPTPTPTVPPTPAPIPPESLLRSNPQIQEVWHYNNRTKEWRWYIRGWQDNTLAEVRRGESYLVFVSENFSMSSQGRTISFYCKGEEERTACMNLVTW